MYCIITLINITYTIDFMTKIDDLSNQKFISFNTFAQNKNNSNTSQDKSESPEREKSVKRVPNVTPVSKAYVFPC